MNVPSVAQKSREDDLQAPTTPYKCETVQDLAAKIRVPGGRSAS